MPTPSQIANDPREFARVFLRIRDKEKRLIPFLWNRAQADFHAARTGRDIILKARQLGVSTYVQGEMFRRTVTSTRTTITLAHDADTTQKLRRMADRFWEYCKFNDMQPARKYANASLTTYPEFDSTAIIATAGNLETGRGDTYTDVHGSEVAFWKDAERIIAGAMQGGSPDVVLESTPNGAQGYFYERCMEAISGGGVWKLHFYPWWWDGEYSIPLATDETIEPNAEESELIEKHGLSAAQIKWRREKTKELGRLFIQEYPEDPITCFLTSGNSYFGDLSGVFTAPNSPEYQEGHLYIAGLDFGQSNDYTVVVVVDHTAGAMVDMLRINNLPWADLRQRIAAMCRKWQVAYINAESNSIGGPNIEALQADGLAIQPFETTNASKAAIMATLHEALHNGLKLQDIQVLRHELNTFVASQHPISKVWRLAADGDGHDDTVIALALANHNLPMQIF